MTNKQIAIIGLGYVGLPLAIAFSEKFEVIGFDTDKNRVNELKDGFDRTLEIKNEQIQLAKPNISYTNNVLDAKKCNVYIITVPTPIDSNNKSDLTHLIDSSKI